MGKKIQMPGKMHEHLKAQATVLTSLINSEEKRVPLILSEETAVIRWDWLNGQYNLTLKHGEENVDLKRADILKLFYQHETHGSTPPIGKLENVRLEDGKLKADAIFDAEDEFAMQIFGKMERGFLESVSVGVSILDGKMTEYKSKPNEYVATRWELNEVSIVNIPAIPTAKVGLSQQQQNQKKDTNMELSLSDITVDFLNENLPEVVAAIGGQEFNKGKDEGHKLGMQEGADAELTRIAALSELSAPGFEHIIAEAKLNKEATVESTKLAIFDAMQTATATAKGNRAEDGTNLAAQAAEVASASEAGNEVDEEKESVNLMANAGQKAQGVK